MMAVVEQMLQHYGATSDAEATNALREVMQEIALAGLNRGGFFRRLRSMTEPACGYFMDCHDSLKIWISLCCNLIPDSCWFRTSRH